MTDVRPVESWATDFDVLSPEYVNDPFRIWDELRGTCPVAHTDRRGSTWLPTRYKDVVALAHDIEHFSSLDIVVIPFTGEEPEEPVLPYGVPPISADPPMHTWTRRLLLPWFSHRRVETYEPMTRALCNRLIDGFIDEGRADAAAGYAQQIPVRVIASILGVPESLSDTFTGWVRDVLEFADDEERRRRGTLALIEYFVTELERRKREPGDDLMSDAAPHRATTGPAARGRRGARRLRPDPHRRGGHDVVGHRLVAVAPGHPSRRRRDAGHRPRGYAAGRRGAPAGLLAGDHGPGRDRRRRIRGLSDARGRQGADELPGRQPGPGGLRGSGQGHPRPGPNRHVAFGSGIHRCAGSNLARMELRVAIEEWLRRIPEFRIDQGAEVTWAGGQVRGPRNVPVVFP